MAADVALLTDGRYVRPKPGNRYVENIFAEDHLVTQALERRGLRAERCDWAGDVDWSAYRCVVFRTTWDYFERYEQFVAWLADVERRTTVINPTSLVRWNMDKRYLLDLQRQGVAVVPTLLVERGTAVDLPSALRERGWSQAVVKPAVSGAARHTYRVEDDDAAARLQPTLERLLEAEAMLVQPFMHDIVDRGEITVMMFGTTFTHAVRKVPQPGDFRVQDDHGGTVHAHTATPDEVAFAIRAFSACPETPAYGRVDLVRDDNGELCVMELELVEPELWFRVHPPAAEALAAEIAHRLISR